MKNIIRTTFLLLFYLCTATFLSGSEYLVIGSQNIAHSVIQALTDLDKKTTVLAPHATAVHPVLKSSSLVDIIIGNVEKDASLVQALAQGKKYIFFCPHFGFKKWLPTMESALKNVIAGAQKAGAKVIMPSKLFSVGKNALPISEDMSSLPCSKQGALCRSLEQTFLNILQSNSCKGVIVRHAHPFGPNIVDGFMDKIFTKALKNEEVSWINQTNAGYQLAYAPNIAKVMIELAHHDSANTGIYHYGGSLVKPIETFLREVTSTAGTTYKLKIYSKKFINFFSMVNEDAAVCKDIMYIFEQTIALDDTKLFRTFPNLHLISLKDSIKQTLDWFKNTP